MLSMITIMMKMSNFWLVTTAKKKRWINSCVANSINDEGSKTNAVNSLQRESTPPPEVLWQFLQNGWEFFDQILRAYYAFLSTLVRIFIQLSVTLTKLCHINRDHPVHIIVCKMSTIGRNARWHFLTFSQTVRNF